MYEIRMTYRSASCTIIVWEDENTATIDTLSADYKRRGHGTGLMQRVANWADGVQINLILRVAPFGDEPKLSYPQLKQFYKRFGFRENSYDIMSRAPQELSKSVDG